MSSEPGVILSIAGYSVLSTGSLSLSTDEHFDLYLPEPLGV